MGGAVSNTFNVLVIGPKDAGKTHFLDMFVYGTDSTKFPTRGFYEASVTFDKHHVHWYECSPISCHALKSISYHMIVLMMRADQPYEYYQRAKNMLYSVLNTQEKVCLYYNCPEGCHRFPMTFEQRNEVFQIPQLSQRVQVSVIEVDVNHPQRWAQTSRRLLEWLTSSSA